MSYVPRFAGRDEVWRNGTDIVEEEHAAKRERYTVIDLARACGILPAATEEILEAYLTK